MNRPPLDCILEVLVVRQIEDDIAKDIVGVWDPDARSCHSLTRLTAVSSTKTGITLAETQIKLTLRAGVATCFAIATSTLLIKPVSGRALLSLAYHLVYNGKTDNGLSCFQSPSYFRLTAYAKEPERCC